MDSTNLYNRHQLQQQQQLAGYPFFTGVSTLHDWNSGITLEEEYYYKLGHMNGLSNNMFKESYFGNEQQHAFDLNENLLSEDSFMNNAKKTSIVFSGFAAGATNLSYVSSHDLEHSDFQGLKFAFDGLNCFGHFTTNRMSSGFADEQQKFTHSTPSKNSSNKIASNVKNNIGVSSKAKRFNYSAEEEAISSQEASKKPRVTSQSSSTLVLKVRKEKLGDRISALHRLVAPFGKTDTASVLTEAIGYIQFLQDQILTLSMPYTKSTQAKLHDLNSKDSTTDMKCKPVLDLGSRGLCLVPTSFSSYITSSSE